MRACEADGVVWWQKPGKKKTSLDSASREELVAFVKKQAVKIKGLEAKVAGEQQKSWPTPSLSAHNNYDP